MQVFSCKKCGRCCEGQGGIVLNSKDITRLCKHLGLETNEFISSCTEKRNNKPVILAGENGFCIFFKCGGGCTVHESKPDVCRAWPFFRGNLVDEISLAMAAQDCPGIAPEADLKTFREQGLRYLELHGLRAELTQDAPNALKI